MMDPFDHEPAVVPSDHSLTPVRLAATGAAGLPAVGLGLLCLSDGMRAAGVLTLDCIFHLVLGAALLLLFVEIAMAIHRAHALGWILLFGVFGFAGSFAAAVLSELNGPPVLGVLVLLVAVLGLVAVWAERRTTDRSRSAAYRA